MIELMWKFYVKKLNTEKDNVNIAVKQKDDHDIFVYNTVHTDSNNKLINMMAKVSITKYIRIRGLIFVQIL